MFDHVRAFLMKIGPNANIRKMADKYEPGTYLYRVTVDYVFNLRPPLEKQLAERWPDNYRGSHWHKNKDNGKTTVEVVFKFPVAEQLDLFSTEEQKQ
jgi:hypothetical protein